MRELAISVLGISVALVSCSSADFADAEQEPQASVSQAFWGSDWTDRSGHTTSSVGGIARGPNFVAHIWFSDGQTCENGTGTAALDATFCVNPSTPYSCGTKSCADLRAVGIARNTSHVYAWFQDGTLMEGVVENLARFNQYPANRFKRPINPLTNLPFAMNDLLDADNSPNGEWYFYWRDPDTKFVFRTTGTSDDATHSPKRVTTLDLPADIIGISFDYLPNRTDRIETWYSNHRLNSSDDSLILTRR